MESNHFIRFTKPVHHLLCFKAIKWTRRESNSPKVDANDLRQPWNMLAHLVKVVRFELTVSRTQTVRDGQLHYTLLCKDGRIRTYSLRVWKPSLCQLELHPYINKSNIVTYLCQIFERHTRLELVLSGWKPDVLAINTNNAWRGRWDSNPRSPA